MVRPCRTEVNWSALAVYVVALLATLPPIAGAQVRHHAAFCYRVPVEVVAALHVLAVEPNGNQGDSLAC
ncbi:MAG: hypothetical protein E8D43_14985 [Nitrospira sp.]|nr:MAG: hypothetical protein E8D43_14985 [Nitrospira sp.]